MSNSAAHRPWVPFALLGALWVLLAFLVIPTWGWTYWDFGDGNYMYISRRVREGLVLYRDILAPQPPLHVMAGVFFGTFGEKFMGGDLYGIRLFCLLVRMAGSLAVMMVALRFFRCPFRAILAAAIYLFLPIGFWWSLCFQSENLENVFLLLAIYFLLPWKNRSAALAGIMSALAIQCNMTGVPYFLANAIFLAFRMPRLLPAYVGATLGMFAITAGVAQWLSHGYYLDNVLLNQVGSFPKTAILQLSDPSDSLAKYIYRKIRDQGMEVLNLCGAIIAIACAGAALVARSAEPEPAHGDPERRATWLRTEYMVWTFIGMLLSICFTAKGGTANYIFVLGEPGVAIFAAAALVPFLRALLPGAIEWKTFSIFQTRALLLFIGVIAAMLIVIQPAWMNIRQTLRFQQSEIPEAQVNELRAFIGTYAEPGDTILAPPFYALATRTNVAGELAENYIWNIKWLNETFENKPGPGVAKMEEIAGMLRRKEIKVVLLDMKQTGRVPVIEAAIAESYQAAEKDPYQTRNTPLMLYIPKGIAPHHLPLGK